MYKNLPECVVLHYLTGEQIYKSYPSESEDNYDISYAVKQKTYELCKTIGRYAAFCRCSVTLSDIFYAKIIILKNSKQTRNLQI